MLNIKKYAINNKGIGFKKRIGVIVVSITNANPFDLDLYLENCDFKLAVVKC